MFAKALYLSIRNVFHFAVPVFFMMSGALLLSPNKKMPINKLMKSYIAKYAGVIIVFGSGSAFMEEVFTTRKINASMVISAFPNMLHGRSWDHMWYMYALLGVILFIPVMHAMIQYFNKQQRCYIIIILVVFLSVLPFLKECFGFSIAVSFPISSVHCMYMFIGYWIDVGELHMKQCIAKIILIVSTIAIISLSVIQVKFGFNIEMFVVYSSPVIAAFSGFIFKIAKNWDSLIVSPKSNPRNRKCIIWSLYYPYVLD